MKTKLIRPLLAAFTLVLLAAAAVVETEHLTGIRQLNEDGFGGDANKYAFSMAVFNDALYVGTLNITTLPNMARFFTGTSTEGATDGAQIWRYTKDGTWTKVVNKGLSGPENFGVRKMIAANDQLWAVTANHGQGMEVWRSKDGERWKRAATGGFGNPGNTSGRGLGWFQGRLYAGTENRKSGAEMWRSPDGENWERMAKAGIDDPANWWFSDFAEFKGRLYMGTLNAKGCGIFRTHDGLHYERVAEGGLEKKTNFAAMKLVVFKDRLYVSTMDFFSGFDLYVSGDGAHFERVIKNGFNNKHNGYLWQMQEYEGRLYGGTYFHSKLKWPAGRFSLLSSEDGTHWSVENDDAFGNEYHYGIRSMAVFDGKLILGTASARYGCKVYEAAGK